MGHWKLQSMHLYYIVLICHNIKMNAPHTRASRVFTISFPEELAKQVVSVANEESRNLSELFREAFRTYQVERAQRRMLATRRITAERISLQGPEDEIEHVSAKTRNE
jgi:metal-responsive CopG/Arc/MetJ family transcriptional regulator